MRLLLDTHVLLWWAGDTGDLSKAQKRALRKVAPAAPALVSDISLWEIANLVSLGRIRLREPLRTWLDRLVAPPLVERVSLSPAVAAAVADLPSTIHRDPADRILVATARVHRAVLVTSDRRLVESRLVETIS